MRKRSLLSSCLVLILLLFHGGASAREQVPEGSAVGQEWEFAPDQLLVRFRLWVAPGKAGRILVDNGLSRIRRIKGIDVDLLQLPPGLSVERAAEILSRLPEVVYAEPNYVLHVLAPPRQGDLEVVDQWGLDMIQVQSAWDAIEPKNPVLLAVVDTGIDRHHPDLAPNIWSEPGEIPCNGLDDDGNGYVDDTWGWDFVNEDGDPFDDNGHGTAVSSNAAGAGVGVADKPGVLGVCPWCKLMAVKVMSGEGSGNLDDVAGGIIYAADNGARVINLSLGATVNLQTLDDAVNHAWAQGAVVVAGAGNNGVRELFYPAAYENAMAVASTNEEDYHSCFSNYEDGFISVAAPGENIFCAIPNQGYAKASGTSISTPLVTGLGGLLFSQDPARTNADVRTLIENSAQDLGPVGVDAFFGHGRISASRAVSGDTTPMTPESGLFSDDLSASGYAHARKLARDDVGALHLTWHGKEGDQYRVLYATSDDDGESWVGPQVVFTSTAETYHPALAVDEFNVYIAFPSRHGSATYGIRFASKPLSGGDWPAEPPAIISGTYDAARPDLYVDPSSGVLHAVASSLDNVSSVYYVSSTNQGVDWSTVISIPVQFNSRYAAVHANGNKVYVAGRTLEFWFGLLPQYRVFTVRSTDGGATWGDLTELALHLGLLSGEYGVSLAGLKDRLYLGYEHSGGIYFRSSDDGVNWGAAQEVGLGAWPSLTQASDGQAWLMWESAGTLNQHHYISPTWGLTATVGSGSYPNLMLGATGGTPEWVATHCSGAPFRVVYGQEDGAGLSVVSPAHGTTVSGIVTVQIHAADAITVEWNVDAGPWQAASHNAGSGYYEATWDTTTSSNGFRHLINARAIDGTGGTTYGFSGVSVENTSAPPTIAILDPTDGATVSGTVEIQIDVTDDAGPAGVLAVEWSVYGGCWQRATYSPTTGYYETTWNSADFPDGSYVLYGQATDRTANTSTTSNSIDVQNGPPTGTHLVSFTATPRSGAILVEWETAFEVDTLGFDLFRSEGEGGSLVQLNGSLIPSSGPTGALYAWLDESVEPGTAYYYWLDEVDTSGQRTRYGPVSAVALLDASHWVYVPVVMSHR